MRAQRFMKRAPSRFSLPNCRDFVRDALAKPPALERIQRIEGVGQLVASFVLPLDLCEPQNNTRYLPEWKRGEIKKRLFTLMMVQHRGVREPLAGRPLIRCIRFSSREPDRFADWAKYAIDHLCIDKWVRGKLRRGLGFIQDDAPKFCQVEQHWEPAPPGEGCVLIEVWTGEEQGS